MSKLRWPDGGHTDSIFRSWYDPIADAARSLMIGFDGAAWQQVAVSASGHLLVDVMGGGGGIVLVTGGTLGGIAGTVNVAATVLDGRLSATILGGTLGGLVDGRVSATVLGGTLAGISGLVAVGITGGTLGGLVDGRVSATVLGGTLGGLVDGRLSATILGGTLAGLVDGRLSATILGGTLAGLVDGRLSATVLGGTLAGISGLVAVGVTGGTLGGLVDGRLSATILGGTLAGVGGLVAVGVTGGTLGGLVDGRLSATILGGTLAGIGGNVTVVGNVANDSAASGNPVTVAAVGDDTEKPATDTDGDVTREWLDRRGRLITRASYPGDLTVKTTTLTNTNESGVTDDPGSTGAIIVYMISATNGSSGLLRIDFRDDNSSTPILSKYMSADGGGFVMQFPDGIRMTADNALTAQLSGTPATNDVRVDVAYKTCTL